MKERKKKMQINQAENKILNAMKGANRRQKQRKRNKCSKSGGIVGFRGVFSGCTKVGESAGNEQKNNFL